ncbi:hypothetical protein Rsub_11873 [Raphidocelis subcapitata]|uniref:Uncharacterized protein n=1 Tax=Raphidocelis subcapitata TaxID=307507 RepID=A0A2V0PKL2_9CHLO|nr:hypothetical protein Rsub_11873 [Raphidocelis subcapitata]|eukprot:GBF98543.1 hypothetical protein Rsub_11873 [Raphidocelis subcapitata]
MGLGQSKEAPKPAPKKEEKKEEGGFLSFLFGKKAPVKAPEPVEEECKLKEALPIVGVVVLVAAIGSYLWKKKPWKKSE